MTSVSAATVFFSLVVVLILGVHIVRTYEYNFPYSLNPVISQQTSYDKLCQNNKLTSCPVIPGEVILNNVATYPSANVRSRILRQLYHIGNSYVGPSATYGMGPDTPELNSYQPLLGRLSIERHANLPNSPYYMRNPLEKLNLLPLYKNLPQMPYIDHIQQNNTIANSNSKMLHAMLSRRKYSSSEKTDEDKIVVTRISYELPPLENQNKSSAFETNSSLNEYQTATTEMPRDEVTEPMSFRRTYIDSVLDQFERALDRFDRNFYKATFTKLSSISPADRRENGISFVQSGLFLYFLLTVLAINVDVETRAEIDSCLDLSVADTDKIRIIKQVLTSFPESNDELKFRWSSRVVLGANVTQVFTSEPVSAMQLKLDRLNGTASPSELTKTLNHMVEVDSGGAMHDTFEEEELTEGARALLLSVVYVRARWRAAPTLLNGTKPFRDAPNTPQRSTRMLRINDIMRYAHLNEWDAEAIEISYATPGLSLLLLVPRGQSLRELAARLANTSLSSVTERMHTLRVAATLPLYTLRMTLLLPSKLQAMGISRLVETTNSTTDSFRLSHAVQRLMFWAEAGRNAFKDDGIEWDEAPELELVVDRPYVFYVRWRNITLMNGNFVL